jgi:hypothetical protein
MDRFARLTNVTVTGVTGAGGTDVVSMAAAVALVMASFHLGRCLPADPYLGDQIPSCHR